MRRAQYGIWKMHFVERKTSILKYFLYYIIYLAEVLIFLALMRTQAKVQSLCKLSIKPLQGFPSFFLLILFLETPTCCSFYHYCSASWINDTKGLLPLCASQMIACASILIFIFIILPRH